ncbi:rna-directed dna polymerase from mobile element jockey-like [Willisornis vidua]|uniref:Rna-directed dna polymerase from mobile element jockey-like n=1 Tax=Willisornis vidua TaxID=1566151 RepID=A0ABQ9CKH0_9PASS|nr:rna-directed dna polymerase from mobile element jockey-like [Willisornis vidua]
MKDLVYKKLSMSQQCALVAKKCLTYVRYLNIGEQFQTDILSLERHEFDGRTTWWIKNWQHGCMQIVVVNCSLSMCRPVMSDVLRTGVLCSISLLATCTVGLSTPSKFADDNKLCDAVATLEAIQEDLCLLERWTDANLMEFHKKKCKVLHLGFGNFRHTQRLGREWIESSPGEKGLGLMIDQKLNLKQQCVLTVQKANCILGCIKRDVISSLRK